MRIALANWTNRLAGGVETYLATVAPALARGGHQLAWLHEFDAPAERDAIAPDSGPAWNAQSMGASEALRRLTDWRPDVVYLHALRDAQLERRLVATAPTVFFAHQYHGTCISGTKTHSAPRPHACSRRFGPPCLTLFYPRRCGGLNPLTMVADYHRSSVRLGNLRSCHTILTHSEHMRVEYLKHGFGPTRVRTVPFPIRWPSGDGREPEPAGESIRLLCATRLERLKGVHLLLDALPAVQAALGRAVTLTVVGDGRERRALEAAARSPAGPVPVRFTGWLSPPALDARFRASDLVVMPSLWPEPFGTVGLEAGHCGVPTAAFAVGGIPEWLQEGVNGSLAPGAPPTAAGLARAIVRCLEYPEVHARLATGARAAARRFALDHHLPPLLAALDAARTG